LHTKSDINKPTVEETRYWGACDQKRAYDLETETQHHWTIY